MENKLNKIYSERNVLAIAFCKMALLAGWNAGKEEFSGDDKWPVIYVDLPDGKQVSWHIASSEQELLKDIPVYKGQWNGEFYGRDRNWVDSIFPVTPNYTEPFLNHDHGHEWYAEGPTVLICRKCGQSPCAVGGIVKPCEL